MSDVNNCTRCGQDIEVEQDHACPVDRHYSNCMDCKSGIPHTLDNGPVWGWAEVQDMTGLKFE